MTATRILLTTLAMLYGSALAADEPPRPQLSLDGQWQFKLDPQDEGVAGQWFAMEATFPDQIMVPGNWQAQGFGEPRGIAKHDYQGKAWYRRGLTVPTAWQGQRIWLRFEGVCNWGEVFLDGAQVGRVDSFVTPQEFDITERIRLGREQRLDVLVDSKTPADSPYIGMMQFLVASGGITSHVRLEARPDPQLDRIRLRAEPGLKGVLASVSARRAQAGVTWQGRCRVRVLDANDAMATEGEAPLAFAADSTMSGTAELRLAFPELRPWSPEDPHLYRVEVTLLDATGAGWQDRPHGVSHPGHRHQHGQLPAQRPAALSAWLWLRQPGADSRLAAAGQGDLRRASAALEELRLQRHSLPLPHAAARILRGRG